ncbi:MAG TPA: ABC transporter ATP-binding protein [Roseiflexaceae bacterium]|nr:ABC transporter ATP-binding protein [Roseiflexaceae bacterium]
MLTTEDLTKRYKSHVAVEGLNLHVRPGEIYGFLGPNGAGKTTTIHMLLNLTQPSSGKITLFDKPLAPGDFRFKQAIGVVAEEPAESTQMTGWEVVRFFARLYGVESPADRMEALFHQLDLWDVRHGLARDYSRGMRQKLSLIRALVHEPKLLILDEPVSGLDPHGIRQVRELISDYSQAGGTVFISSHILSEIERSADRIGILHQGHLLIEDTLAGLRGRLTQQQKCMVELEAIPEGLLNRLEHADYVLDFSREGRQINATLGAEADARSRLSRLIAETGGVILKMQSEDMSLEDAFVTITSQNVGQLAGVA